MGERKRKLKEVVVAVKQATDELAHHGAPMSVATAGGRFQVKWDTKSNATAMGQLAFFAYVPRGGGRVRAVGEAVSALLHQSERARGARCAGHLAAVNPGRTSTLRACRKPARRRGRDADTGDEPDRRRRECAARAGAHRPGAVLEAQRRRAGRAAGASAEGLGMDGPGAARERAACLGYGVDPRRRHDGQDAVWPPGGGRDRLQPTQAGAPEPYRPHLLGRQPAAGAAGGSFRAANRAAPPTACPG
jgi:hypothetical protein